MRIFLTSVEVKFAGQIATAVWLSKLTDASAREALLSYAIARHPCRRELSRLLEVALTSEYLHWRERQDIAS